MVQAVAAGLAEAKPHCLVFFITHLAHESLTKVLSASGVSFVSITSPPVLSASCLHRYITADDSVNTRPQSIQDVNVHPGIGWKLRIEELHRQECLIAVGNILNCEHQHGDHIIINFFALEGWHLAEVYQVPCAVAAPYVMPYSAPVSFERSFMKRHPLLYDKLKRRVPGTVGWEDVMHWMWPLFTDRWTEWRAKLHLSSCPLTDPVTDLPRVHNWPSEPLLLYGFSKHVVECPPYWPSTAHACGFWFLRERISDSEFQQSAYSELIAFLKESTISPIFFGLSSIGSMGLIDNPKGMLDVLGGVLRAADRYAILFTAAHAPLEAAVLDAANQDDRQTANDADEELQKEVLAVEKVLQQGIRLFGNRLFCMSGSLPYLWLFPKCSLIVHHGGSGTTAAALQSGIPQVICPFVLDQFYWAERMAWIAVAPEPLKKEYLVPPAHSETHIAVDKLLRAINEASSPRIRACAAELGEKIRNEDGVNVAVEALCRTMLI
ncbi:hypothetical protein GOP47_0019905 [Adiantum capillus-veneris]|uniref:Erythromycin biosynthesis protein CIII-like C-terminal domain-containing protein n=1 Tax=Adiantum capillus-veneris TaxID=13818 RepID=A0A9D4UC72_ADICA|nr:hypothetical protein GOP47_0019905 [Adiantum capillus-veneris]